MSQRFLLCIVLLFLLPGVFTLSAGNSPTAPMEQSDEPAAVAPARIRTAKARGVAQAEAETATTPAGKVYVYKESGGNPRELEIYFPPNHSPTKAKVPGLILFHGGGWSGGSLSQFRAACNYFASRGLVAATANYQMLNASQAKQLGRDESRKRVCITDAKSAIRWFKQHAEELGIDPQRIITGGGSAGGHISVLATSNRGLNDPTDPPEITTSVAAYLLFNPAFALDDPADPEVDVMKHIQPDLAPAIVFFGTNDKWKEGWDVLHQKLKASGNSSTQLHLAPGQAHSFFNKEPWRTVTLLAADRFLVEHGFLSGEPLLVAPTTGERLVPHF
jgi:acetyl esterase